MPTASLERRVYIISDLHLGGAAPDERGTGSPSFRIMTQSQALADFILRIAAEAKHRPTELVINGDFVDLLAEQHEEEPMWRAFTSNPHTAVSIVRRLIERDRCVFDALAQLLAAGGALTILSGNHDVELTFPSVRRELLATLKAENRRQLLHIVDGESYAIGDALIEHGHDHDPFNRVDYSGLRDVRQAHSRRSYPSANQFVPPKGSVLVAELMNPIKERHPFIDLLKPESEALFALILALEPGTRDKLADLAKILVFDPLAARAQKTFEVVCAPISASPPLPQQEADSPLRTILTQGVGSELADALLRNVDALTTEVESVPIASIGAKLSAFGGIIRLMIARGDARADECIGLIQSCLRALEGDDSFSLSTEANARYLEAANRISMGEGDFQPFRCVVFGHTHFAKSLLLPSGARYLNSGTWANRMRFPAALRSDDALEVRHALAQFYEDLEHGRLSAHIEFDPTYVVIDVGAGDRILDASLGTYRHGVFESLG